uniref:auxin-responsive protein IAA32-like n=1 Tax=Erigeron canadensis TaxID=72917 RepID=UPI001CB99EE5|nr:auxin-responsive protein IAA32-like [Erigeron canadensis]
MANSDSSSTTYLLNQHNANDHHLPSIYYQANNNNNENNNGGIIDLGLSLRVLQPPTNNYSYINGSVNPHHDDYRDMVEWNHHPITMHPYEGSPDDIDVNIIYPSCRKTDNKYHAVNIYERDVFHRIQLQQSEFVKVNMDGVLIGRKICVVNHSSYLSLATQLEEMFGKQSVCGLRLFQSGSEFSLWYKDRDGQWRMVGDVPWKEFVDGVKRIRIMLN